MRKKQNSIINRSNKYMQYALVEIVKSYKKLNEKRLFTCTINQNQQM